MGVAGNVLGVLAAFGRITRDADMCLPDDRSSLTAKGRVGQGPAPEGATERDHSPFGDYAREIRSFRGQT